MMMLMLITVTLESLFKIVSLRNSVYKCAVSKTDNASKEQRKSQKKEGSRVEEEDFANRQKGVSVGRGNQYHKFCKAATEGEDRGKVTFLPSFFFFET